MYDSVKRLLKETDVHEDVTASVLVLPDIVIPRADAEGWYVTLGSGVAQRLTTGNSIEFLIDNEEAWGHITNSVGIANGHIRFVLLLWDVEDMITLFNPGQPVIGSPTAGRKLDDEVVAANAAPRSLPVGIVMWDVLNWPDWMPPDFTSQCETFFGKPGQTIGFRSYNIHLFTPMHAKCAIVPTPGAIEGYLIGSPFIQEYFDDHIHRIDEPRRGEMHWPKNQIVIPIHDVSSHIRGPAVADIDATFRLHWDSLNQPADPPATPIPVPPAQADNVEIQIVRTLPGDRFAGLPHGETGVLEAYLRAIKNATDYIYIENQYFTSDDIADALLLALKQKPALQVIMLINNRVDVPLYGAIGIPVLGWLFDGWQVNLIERLLENLTASERDRIGIFTRWTHDVSSADNPKPRIIRNYVHSKVAVVDDKWATAGSTNLDGVGLKTSQHFLLLDTLLFGIPDFTDRRSSEMNAVIYNGVEAGHPSTTQVGLLRRRLWSEHLGFVDGSGNPNPNASQVTNRPAPGWLSLWKERAAANVTALKANPPAVHPARILPFPHDNGDVSHLIDKVSTYLNLNGIDPSTLKLQEEVRDFRFQTGKWV